MTLLLSGCDLKKTKKTKQANGERREEEEIDINEETRQRRQIKIKETGLTFLFCWPCDFQTQPSTSRIMLFFLWWEPSDNMSARKCMEFWVCL
jgi:hypothetical protein